MDKYCSSYYLLQNRQDWALALCVTDVMSRDKHCMEAGGTPKTKPLRNAEKRGWLRELRNISQESMMFQKYLREL